MVFVLLICFGQKSTQQIKEVLWQLQVGFLITHSNIDKIPAQVTHIILSGGPSHVYDDHAPLIPACVLYTKLPLLGICYGMQSLIYQLFGSIYRLPQLEKGLIPIINCQTKEKYFRWMNRYDGVYHIPSSFKIIERTETGAIAACTDQNNIWTVQYHPEAKESQDLNFFKLFIENKLF